MQKSGIEWCDYTSNPVKGECPVGCSYCYVKPFRTRYGWHKDLHFYPQELESIRKRKKPTGIFLGSTIELFHDKTIQYMPEIMDTIKSCPQHRFYLLTKQPQNLAQWSPFPENVWLGVSATNQQQFDDAVKYLKQVEAKVKFLSMEPLLGHIDLSSYIGYTEPVYKEVSNAAEIQRRDYLSSGGAGGVGNRRYGSNLASQEPNWKPVGERSFDNTMPQTQSRKRYGEISTSQSNGGLEENSLPSPSASLEAFPRANPREYDGQSQEWQQEGQQTKQSRISDLFREHSTHVAHSSEGQGFEPERREQCNGEVDQRGCEGNQGAFGRDNSGNENETWTQDKGISSQVRSGLSHNLGCNPQKSLELNLIIIGAQTKPYKPPKIEWVKEIVEATDRVGIKVFFKDNIRPLLVDALADGQIERDQYFVQTTEGWGVRQEMPTL